MAIVKHIKSRNANYSAAINYLPFEHDEKTGKKIVDESGRSILRKEFYMDGLNCDPMSFDKECELTNAHFHKNKKREDIKSHHYIISYDPADVTENRLTGERAQTISLELAKQMFPRYQALVVTHTDGHNESGNIHTHIVINSVRKTALIIPHICRWIIKDDNRYSMPLNIIVGAIQNAGTIYADQWQYRCSPCPVREARPRLSARSF